MFYAYDVTIPANTTEVAAVETELQLNEGIIHRIGIGFPENCSGLARVRLLRFSHPVFPTNKDAKFQWDGEAVWWDEYLPLRDSPFTLTAHSWNLDDTYPHTITIWIGVMPWEVYWRLAPSRQLEQQLQRAFGLPSL